MLLTIIFCIIIILLMSSPSKTKSKSYFSSEYQEFIRSPEWKTKRAKIIKRDGNKCRKCGCKASKGNALQVDHIRYPKRGSSVAAFQKQAMADLQTLCVRCHKAKTRNDRANRSK